MPEQITPLSILYLQLHGAGTAVAAVLFLYLLLCRGKAIAPDITPPARLRRWAAALFDGPGSRLVDTVLHVLGRHQLGDLRAARRYGLYGTAFRLRRHAAGHAAGPPPTAVAHCSRYDALCGDCSAADSPAIH